MRLSDGALESLVARTEGWAAGLRLAALSLARDSDPERLAAGFSGRERGVAEYLLAEVLERQPQEVSRLLLRTSILDRVSGPLADRLTGCSGSERILCELEDAGAFVVSLDPERSWFRYHHLFADLLALELRRTAPEELPGLHADGGRVDGRPRVSGRSDSPRAGGRGLGSRDAAARGQLVRCSSSTAGSSRRASSCRGFPPEWSGRFRSWQCSPRPTERCGGSLDEAERLPGAGGARVGVGRLEDRRDRFQVALAFMRLCVGRDPQRPRRGRRGGAANCSL